MRASRIHLVADPEDIREHYEHVISLHDLTDGRAVCELTTGGRNAFWLAQDVLDGLGKRPDGLSGGREAWMSLDRAATWLAGEGVTSLFVLRADERDAGAWRLLIGLAAQVGCDLWLLTNSEMLPRGHRELLEDWAAERMGWQKFVQRWPRPNRHKASPAGRRSAGASATLGVPRDDFPTFRAACRRLLSPCDFEQVDGELTAARAGVEARVRHVPDFARDEALTWVRELLDDAPSLDARVVRLRGAQVALFHVGFLLSVRIDLLASAFVNASRSPLDADAADALREHHHTRAVAAAVLGLVTDASSVELVELSMRCIRREGAAVRVGRQWHTVPAHARGLLNAHLHQRLLDGATEQDPFLAVRAGEGEVAMTPENLRKELGRLSRLSGVLLVSDWTRHANETTEAWFSRRGVALRPLLGVARPGTATRGRSTTSKRSAA